LEEKGPQEGEKRGRVKKNEIPSLQHCWKLGISHPTKGLIPPITGTLKVSGGWTMRRGDGEEEKGSFKMLFLGKGGASRGKKNLKGGEINHSRGFWLN